MAVPITCIDNFYSNPDKIRDFALSLKFFSAGKKDNFPGERTKCLSVINKDFFDQSCQKLFSLFFDFTTPVNWVVTTRFQKIYPYHKDPKNLLNTGWSHLDNDHIFAGVVYLNKNPNPNSGTMLLTPNSQFSSIQDSDISYRNKLYHNQKIDEKIYAKKIQEHNKKFDITLEVKNKYNRLICYNHNIWHRVSNFCTDEEFRLTQVFFIKELKANSFPTQRVKEINTL